MKKEKRNAPAERLHRLKTGLAALFLLCTFGACAQPVNTEKKMETKTTNPLLCDPATGMCEMPGTGDSTKAVIDAVVKPIRIVYFTDPICSSCWGIEPQLRKLKLEYGPYIEIDYRMGGLLPDWSYNSGGISKPSDVAHHWDEVSQYYEMPIDGDVWLEDPLSSSYPPSIAFKAAQLQDEHKAVEFLRRIREMVFLEKKNITKWEHLAKAAAEVGLDAAQLKTDMEGRGAEFFRQDLELGKQLGVRGFPTMYIADAANNQRIVYGSKPYAEYEQAILALFPAAKKQPIDDEAKALFSHYPTLTAKEFAVLSGITFQQAVVALDKLYTEGYLHKTTTKNGDMWRKQ